MCTADQSDLCGRVSLWGERNQISAIAPQIHPLPHIRARTIPHSIFYTRALSGTVLIKAFVLVPCCHYLISGADLSQARSITVIENTLSHVKRGEGVFLIIILMLVVGPCQTSKF